MSGRLVKQRALISGEHEVAVVAPTKLALVASTILTVDITMKSRIVITLLGCLLLCLFQSVQSGNILALAALDSGSHLLSMRPLINA